MFGSEHVFFHEIHSGSEADLEVCLLGREHTFVHERHLRNEADLEIYCTKNFVDLLFFPDMPCNMKFARRIM